MNFAGGTVNAMINNLYDGDGATNNGKTHGQGNGSFSFGGSASVVNINNLYVGQTQSTGGTNNLTSSTGTFNMSGGSLVMNTTAILANDQSSGTSSITGYVQQTVQGTFISRPAAPPSRAGPVRQPDPRQSY